MSESVFSVEPRPFLNVTRSVLGRPWHERCDAARAVIATAIAQTHGVPDVLARVLAGRGVSVQAAPGFLEPRLRDLMPDPHGMTDMAAAAARLADAVERRETVAIFGDYDVDGACSAALLGEFLRACGVPFLIHIPDRITEGYGPNVEAIRALAGQGARLLVTVDCGTASHEPLAEAARLGLDTVVLDHHQAPERLPAAAALVNPNRQDDLSGLGHLCAAGVVFLTLVALNRALRERGFWNARPAPDLLAGLDLVALATVADVVPLDRAEPRLRAPGPRRSCAAGSGPDSPPSPTSRRSRAAPECWHLGYLLGPRINAGGRIGDAALGARLLLEPDAVAAGRVAAELDRLNRERQAIEQAAVAEAEAEALLTLDRTPDTAVIVTRSAAWHPGIVGLAAARLKERFRRPAFAFTIGPDGSATGSGRSVPGADLGRVVRAAVEAGLATKGGGHAMAAGVTLPAAELDRFTAFVGERLADAVGDAQRLDALAVDASLSAGGARAEIVAAVERAGPFGAGQPEPVFAFANHRLVDAREVGGAGHVRVTLRGGDGATLGGIAFRAAGQPLGQALRSAVGADLHVAGTLCIDRWGGGERVEIRVADAALPA